MDPFALIDYTCAFTLSRQQKVGLLRLFHAEQQFGSNFLADPRGSGKTLLLVCLLAFLAEHPYRSILFYELQSMPLVCIDIMNGYLGYDSDENQTTLIYAETSSIAFWKTLLDRTTLKVKVLTQKPDGIAHLKPTPPRPLQVDLQGFDVILAQPKYFVSNLNHKWRRVILDDVRVKNYFNCHHLWTTSTTANDSLRWRLGFAGLNRVLTLEKGSTKEPIQAKTVEALPTEVLWSPTEHRTRELLDSPQKAWLISPVKSINADKEPSLVEAQCQDPRLSPMFGALSPTCLRARDHDHTHPSGARPKIPLRCVRCLLQAFPLLYLACCPQSLLYCAPCRREIKTCPSCRRTNPPFGVFKECVAPHFASYASYAQPRSPYSSLPPTFNQPGFMPGFIPARGFNSGENFNSGDNSAHVPRYYLDPQLDVLCRTVHNECRQRRSVCVFAEGSYSTRMLGRQLNRLNIDFAFMKGGYKTLQQRMKSFEEGKIPVLVFNNTKNTKGIHLANADTLVVDHNVSLGNSLQVGVSPIRNKPCTALQLQVPRHMLVVP